MSVSLAMFSAVSVWPGKSQSQGNRSLSYLNCHWNESGKKSSYLSLPFHNLTKSESILD